jgi:hypothetical protein
MNPAPFPHPQPPLILTPKDEAILQAFATYRFLTSQEIVALLYSQGSKTYGRARCSRLAGNMDVTDKALTYGYPLLRFGFPTGRLGNQEKIYCLSATGARIIERVGHTLPWYLKPAKLTFSHSYLLHDLTCNRFVVSLLAWAKRKPNLSIQFYLSYELSSRPAVVEIPVQGKMVKVSVIPDGLILVTNTHTGERLLILLEIDYNTLAAARLRIHIASRLAYARSQHFRDTYGNIPYRIVYATQGLTESASRARLAYLCDFSRKLLLELKRPQDSQYFRFTSIDYARLYTDAKHLLEEPSWYLPGDVKRQSPVALFADAKPQSQKEQAHATH